MNEITTLGYALLHSLWQATLLAGVLWLFSRQPKISAGLRYRMAFAMLWIQLLCSVGTYFYYYQPVASTTATPPPEAVLLWLLAGPVEASAVSQSWWEPGLVLLVVVWLLGMLMGGVRLGVSLRRSRRLRSVSTSLPSEALSATLWRLSRRLGLRRPPVLRLSQIIDGPALTGHLRPVLLLPVAAVNQLTLAETEAVLLHELAHLRRYDHWFNLAQCLIEVIYYYHPAVHWIGRRIREEREYCCDDLVLRHGPGRLPYARALLHFGGGPALTDRQLFLALTDGGLLPRLRRLVNQQTNNYRMKSRLLLLPLLAGIALVVASTTDAPDVAVSPADVTNVRPFLPEGPAPAAAPIVDTLPDGKHEVTRIANGKTTRLKVSDGEIQELEIEGRVVPPEEFEEHEEMAEELLGVRPLRARRWQSDEDLPDGWHFEFSPDSLLRISERALSGIDTDVLRRMMGFARVQMDSARTEMKRAHRQMEDFHFDYDQMENPRIDMDSLQRTLQIDMDSFMRDFNPPQMEFFNTRPGTMEELEEEERRLKEALQRLEERREELNNTRRSY